MPVFQNQPVGSDMHFTAVVQPMTFPPLDHPANSGLRRHREPGHQKRGLPALASPDQVTRPYETLGTHPDLVARLWDELQSRLPMDCRVIFYGTPALMHPATGIVFGFAGGTHTYALRLPEPSRAQALRAGATRIKHYPVSQPSFDLADIGPDWVFCGWFADEETWCLAAFEYAGAGAAES
jgi:hypothetical protein